MPSNAQSSGTRPYVRCLVVAGLALGFVLFWIVPQFKPALEASRVTPSATVIAVIKSSDWVVNYFYLVLAAPLLGWLLFQLIPKNSWGSDMLTQFTRRIPLLGKYSPS